MKKDDEMPPETPWAQLCLGMAVVCGSLFGLWFALQCFPIVEQVATR